MINYPTFRNPVFSLWQSAILKAGKSGAFYHDQYEAMSHFIEVAHAFSYGRGVPARNVIDDCVTLVAGLALAESQGDDRLYQELMNKFKMSTCDPGWYETLNVYLSFKNEKGVIPYIRYKQLSDFIIKIPDHIKIAFIADWGTGTQAAEWLLRKVQSHKPDLIIHLGDIYYSGTMDEVREHFLEIVKKVVGSTPVYTLAGNHEMYSGGKGYYWLLEQLKQPASYFCLRNKYWQFLAMDTGLHDSTPVFSKVPHLEPREELWHLDKFHTAGKRKTILLSHHPLFSASGVGKDGSGNPIAFNPYLHSTFRHVLHGVSLWLWGHEHNLAIFEPYLHLNKGRCIGSGSIPTMVDQNPYKPPTHFNLQGQNGPPMMNVKEAKLSVNKEGFYYNSYAIMSLKGRDAEIRYYQVNAIQNEESKLLFRESV